jgi:D-3-phosphoglycerate dehydrogenase / 2-oxoglutarate reductase
MKTRMPAEVWFEREILADLRAEVEERVTVLGPADATPDDPHRDLASAQGAVVSAHVFDAALMDLAPGLRVIARTGIGIDRVDVVAATERGIAVCNTPDAPSVSTAEHALTLMLAVAKDLQGARTRQLHGGPADMYAIHIGRELRGQTLGLVGFGRIPRLLAGCGRALGMHVAAHDPFVDAAAFPPDVAAVASLPELLAGSDIVSLHAPLSDATHHLIDAEALSHMRVGAILVNTARGGLVDLDALSAALDSGQLSGAGLDVTDPEPLPAAHPLLRRDDVVITPHIAAATEQAKRRIFRSAFAQVLDVLDGRRPPHLVNPQIARFSSPRPRSDTA